MDTNEFKAQVVAAGAIFGQKEEVDTNNAWGFGGRTGVDYIFRSEGEGLFTLRTGRLYFRHLKSERLKPVVKVSGIHRGFVPELFLRLFKEGGLAAVRRYVEELKEKGN